MPSLDLASRSALTVTFTRARLQPAASAKSAVTECNPVAEKAVAVPSVMMVTVYVSDGFLQKGWCCGSISAQLDTARDRDNCAVTVH